ncbi:MAG: hypothetical protein ACK4IC_09990 [Erythrobacter sp.]
MTGWRKNRARAAGSSKSPRRRLALHPLFGWVLGMWGAALGGLVTLVLPRDLVLEAAAKAGLASLGAHAPLVLAAIAALGLGGVMFILAGLVTRAAHKARRSQDMPSLATLAVRHVQTIDPARELGSRRLDDPVETMPFAAVKPASATDAPAVAAQTDAAPPPLELNLEEFAALPGRNAVWVEAASILGANSPEPDVPAEPAPEPVLQAVAPSPHPLAPRAPAPGAIAHLRAVPTSELSLVQMVERFAAALHEHQTAAPGRGPQRAGQPGREAALAEALKALAAISPDEKDSARGEPLRAALARLQELRGAA